MRVPHGLDWPQPTKPWDLYLQWVDVLLKEYYMQGDMERERGMNVTPMLDRTKPIPMPKFQMGFLKAIVLPLFEELHRVPGVDVSEPLRTLKVSFAFFRLGDDLSFGGLVAPAECEYQMPFAISFICLCAV